jgi:spermidine/putrescine-binding protein
MPPDTTETPTQLGSVLGNTAVSRRQFLTRGAAAVAGASLASGGLAARATASTGNIGGNLNLLAWQGYEGNGFVNAWRNANHISIHETPISSNDQILTGLRAGGIGRYSLVTPNVAYAQLLHAAGLIQPIDYSRLSNTAKLLAGVVRTAHPTAEIGGKMYAVPYFWGYDGLMYNASKIPKPKSWMDVLKPEYKGKVVMMAGVNPNWEIWPRVLGYDLARLTKPQLANVVKFLIHLKKTQCRALLPDGPSVADAMARGDVWICCSGVFTGTPEQAPKGDKLVAFLPPDGGASWIDSWQIPQQAPNLATAYAYINHMISVSVQTKMGDKFVEATVNRKAVSGMSKSNAALFDYKAAAIGTKRAPLFQFSLGGGRVSGYEDWQLAWEQVQSA